MNRQRNKRQSSLPPHLARLYSTARWRRRRQRQLELEPRCVACLNEHKLTIATVADHINQATDLHSFWSGQLQSLCATHHQSKRQAEALGTKWRPNLGCDVNGWPIGEHPWNE